MKEIKASQKIKGNFIHMVFFWLKHPEDQNDRKAFEHAIHKFIDNNTQVIGAHIGSPAETDRPVIDRSYTYSLVVTFPDLKTHDAYQTDPGHLLFIEEAKPLWEKVVIYDSTAQ
jgi:hypothetical protein